MTVKLDPRLKALVDEVMAGGGSKRAAACLRVMLDKGWISTDDINDLGYNHPPRAIGDVRDTGIPVIRSAGTSRSGAQMGVYSLGSPNDIQDGRIGGRSALPKKFKEALIARYGSQDCITGARLDPRVLQIDHRIPYRIAGDAGLSDHNVEAYMLLDASSQRAKSWSCEQCPNMAPSSRDPAICITCFWAFPENYQHIATEEIRRTDVTWQGAYVEVHDRLRAAAASEGLAPEEYLRQLAAAKLNEG